MIIVRIEMIKYDIWRHFFGAGGKLYFLSQFLFSLIPRIVSIVIRNFLIYVTYCFKTGTFFRIQMYIST